MANHTVRTALLGLLALLAAGCTRFGRVEQGQVIAYDRSAGVVKLIRDSNFRDPANPRFDVLPPVAVRVPQDPNEMGPEPEPGKLLVLDWEAGRAVIFDDATQSLREIHVAVLEVQRNVARDDARLGGRKFPVIDRAAKTVTVLVPRRRAIVTFRPPEETLALPEECWKVGDEVRYYYKQPEQALRMMNVSKTDIGGKTS